MRSSQIRPLRKRYGWTQSELAARLGTDAVTVSRWERGVSQPRPSAQMKLNELKTDLPSDIGSLVRLLGTPEAMRVLKRRLLLAQRRPSHRFARKPALRLQEVERARREQMALKAHARLK